jgi:hypothetical protein
MDSVALQSVFYALQPSLGKYCDGNESNSMRSFASHAGILPLFRPDFVHNVACLLHELRIGNFEVTDQVLTGNTPFLEKLC